MSVDLSTIEADELARHEAVIKRGLTSFLEVGNALLAIRDGRLYRAEFGTFEDYCRERWGISRSRAYRLIDASEVAEDLSPMGDKPDSERQVRPLKALPREDRAEAFAEAKAKANGKPTAKEVKAVVDHRLGKPTPAIAVSSQGLHIGQNAPPAPEPAHDPETPGSTPDPEPEPKPTGQSRVNGELVPDPPEIAAMRAAGSIPAEAVPEIDEPEEAGDVIEPFEAPPEPSEDDLSDEDWLQTLPARSRLDGSPRKTFDADALLYRDLRKARDTFRHHASRLMSKATRRKGAYHYLVSRFLKCNHPRLWLRCPDTEHGGCGGVGAVPTVGECPKCFGRGYWIH